MEQLLRGVAERLGMFFHAPVFKNIVNNIIPIEG
jgi:hypothetical protein